SSARSLCVRAGVTEGARDGQRDLPTGTVTFLFSDIEGSTRLLKQLGRERYGGLLPQHNVLLREAFTEHGGTEIDRQGDAFFYVFRSAGTAVAAAVAAQRALESYEWPEDGTVKVRIGLHTGEASVNGEGYVGFAVHQAARIGDLGHGGQILVSRTTAALPDAAPPRPSSRGGRPRSSSTSSEAVSASASSARPGCPDSTARRRSSRSSATACPTASRRSAPAGR